MTSMARAQDIMHILFLIGKNVRPPYMGSKYKQKNCRIFNTWEFITSKKIL
jgi:hypothetical protein